MLNVRRSFVLALFLICAASCALAYPVTYTINVTLVEIPGDADPFGLGNTNPPTTATITTTLESVAVPVGATSATYNASFSLTSNQALLNGLVNTGHLTINTNGTITADFTNTLGSFTATVALPETFPSPALLPFNSVSISSPASSISYSVATNPPTVGTVGLDGTVSAAGLSATPSSITASYSGSSAPASQTITVNDSSSAQAFTAVIGPGSNNSSTSFLLVTPASGTTPGTLTLTFSTSVAPGTYTASVLINTSADTSGAPLSVPVTYTVSTSNQPQLIVSPGSLSFTFYPPSSTTTAALPISISVPSGASNGGYTASIASGSSFLSVSPTSGNTPATIMVTANSSGLANGTYSGSVAISVAGYPAVNLPVTVNVSSSSGGGGGTSGITLSPRSLTFDVTAGSFTASAATVQVSTPTPVTFTVTGNEFYLPISPASGTTNATITVGVNASTLMNGTYADNITITAGGQTVTLPVTVNVGSISDISLNQFSASFTSPGGPLSQAIMINSDSSPFTYTLTPSAPWITVTPATGSTPSTFTITANPAGLPVGISKGTVTVTAPGARNSPQVIQVSLNVTQATATPLTATPSAILFAAAPGGAAPAGQTIQLAPATLTPAYSVTAVGSSWLSATLDAATGAITLTANPAGLAAGTYPGSVSISSTGLSNSPDFVPVTLVVSSTATFSVAPAALNFGGTAGGASPAPQTVALTFVGGVASTSTTIGANPAPWLTVAISGSTLTVTADTAGLAAGTYTTSVAVNGASGSGAQTIAIPVTLTVGSPATPVISAVTSAISYVTTAPGAPGGLMAVWGSNLTLGTSLGNTPSASPYAAVNSFGAVLNGVEVFADGIPCPVLYASPNQINVILPFALAGQTTANIYLNAYGIISNTVTIPIAPTSPALFSATSNGTGAGAILNPDLTLNTATSPAPAGTEIALFGGGAGVTSPFPADGQVIPTTTPFPTLAATVTATVAGQPATVDYSGDAPGLVAGVLQVNITIPPGTPSGAQPVVINVGGVNSQSGITVYVQ